MSEVTKCKCCGKPTHEKYAPCSCCGAPLERPGEAPEPPRRLTRRRRSAVALWLVKHRPQDRPGGGRAVTFARVVAWLEANPWALEHPRLPMCEVVERALSPRGEEATKCSR